MVMAAEFGASPYDPPRVLGRVLAPSTMRNAHFLICSFWHSINPAMLWCEPEPATLSRYFLGRDGGNRFNATLERAGG